MTDDKTIRYNRLLQDLRDKTGLSLEKVQQAVNADVMANSIFEILYPQLQSFNERADTAESAAKAAAQKADLASLKAQQFFVRLREGGLLKEGESY
jgi:hypothetical protein